MRRNRSLVAAPLRILVPIDFAVDSSRALHEAAGLATKKTEIVLLHVIDPLFFGRRTDPGEDFADHSIVTDCAHHLREILDQLERPTKSRILVRQGPADAEILRAIRELEPDVVVMMAGGKFDDLALDEEADRTVRSVLRQTSCPILLLERD